MISQQRINAKIQSFKAQYPDWANMNWSMGTMEKNAIYELEYEDYAKNYNGGINQIEMGEF